MVRQRRTPSEQSCTTRGKQTRAAVLPRLDLPFQARKITGTTRGMPVATRGSMEKKPDSSATPLEGEGSYTGTRRYNEHLKQHQKTHNTEELAEEARKALEGDEKAALEQAEKQGKSGPARRSSQDKSN